MPLHPFPAVLSLTWGRLIFSCVLVAILASFLPNNLVSLLVYVPRGLFLVYVAGVWGDVSVCRGVMRAHTAFIVGLITRVKRVTVQRLWVVRLIASTRGLDVSFGDQVRFIGSISRIWRCVTTTQTSPVVITTWSSRCEFITGAGRRERLLFDVARAGCCLRIMQIVGARWAVIVWVMSVIRSIVVMFAFPPVVSAILEHKSTGCRCVCDGMFYRGLLLVAGSLSRTFVAAVAAILCVVNIGGVSAARFLWVMCEVGILCGREPSVLPFPFVTVCVTHAAFVVRALRVWFASRRHRIIGARFFCGECTIWLGYVIVIALRIVFVTWRMCGFSVARVRVIWLVSVVWVMRTRSIAGINWELRLA